MVQEGHNLQVVLVYEGEEAMVALSVHDTFGTGVGGGKGDQDVGSIHLIMVSFDQKNFD